MNNKDKETLSQLMDGEWHSLDPANTVKSVCADENQKATWSRYHLIRDVVRSEAISVDNSLSLRISQAIADEPTYSNVSSITPGAMLANEQVVQKVKKTGQWRTGLTGLALAACVALATVVGLNVWQQGAPNSGSSLQSVAVAPGVVLPEVEYVSNRGTYWVTPAATRSAKAEKRLNALLSTHIETSPTAERSGMLPYSRLVGYDSVNTER